MEAPATESAFPAPPERFKAFTETNLNLLKLLRERTNTSEGQALPEGTSQAEVLNDQAADSIPAFELTDLEKPHVDWVVEGGRFDMFSNPWAIVDGQPVLPQPRKSIFELPSTNGDRRPALHKLLKTLLRTWYTALGSMIEHIPVDDTVPTPFLEDAHYMNEIGYCFLDIVNGFRPLQARENLEQQLLKQLRERRDETQRIHQCDVISKNIADLRSQVLAAKYRAGTSSSADDSKSAGDGFTQATPEDVFNWAEQVG